jgi:hypothetical protein
MSLAPGARMPVCKYACVFSAAVDPPSDPQGSSDPGKDPGQGSSRAPPCPRAPKAARSGSFAARAARAARRACRACERCRSARAERGSRIALSGAVATCIETEKAQYACSIIFITCGIGFADAAAADQLLTLLGLIWFGQPGSPSPGAPQLQPSTWKSWRGQL